MPLERGSAGEHISFSARRRGVFRRPQQTPLARESAGVHVFFARRRGLSAAPLPQAGSRRWKRHMSEAEAAYV